jgi:transposase
MAYSKDVREKVMSYIAKGHTQEEATRVFEISESAIKEWKKLQAETGSLSKKELNRQPRKYTPEKIAEILTKKPDAYLSEIAEQFENGSISGVQTALKRMKITVKKRQKSTKNEMNRNGESTKKP